MFRHLTAQQPQEASCLVSLNGTAQSFTLALVGDGRRMCIEDVTFTPLVDLTKPAAGTPAIITVGSPQESGEMRRRVSWRLDSTNTSMDLTAAKENYLRASKNAVPDTLAENVSLSYTTTATPADAGGVHGIVYPSTGLAWRNGTPGVMADMATVDAPALIACQYTPSGGAGEAGMVVVHVLWSYADTNRKQA